MLKPTNPQFIEQFTKIAPKSTSKKLLNTWKFRATFNPLPHRSHGESRSTHPTLTHNQEFQMKHCLQSVFLDSNRRNFIMSLL
jgi:hypothetical protein